jgi:DNA polymerase-3 subunit epsilon
MHAAAAEQRYERAIWLRRRARRLGVILERLDGVLEATHSRARLILAPHPTAPSFDAFWLAGGRLVDWGPLPDDPQVLAARTSAARARAARAGDLGAHIPPEEIDEIRIIGNYLASHPHIPQLILDAEADLEALERFVQANGNSTTSAVAPA